MRVLVHRRPTSPMLIKNCVLKHNEATYKNRHIARFLALTASRRQTDWKKLLVLWQDTCPPDFDSRLLPYGLEYRCSHYCGASRIMQRFICWTRLIPVSNHTVLSRLILCDEYQFFCTLYQRINVRVKYELIISPMLTFEVVLTH